MTGMFATYLQKDLQLSPALVALPVMLLSIGQFGSGVAWGWVADRIGRRWAIILPALIGLPLVPLYLFTHNYAMIVVFFGLQGWFAGGGIWSQAPSYLVRALPDRGARDGVRVLLHQGAIWGGFAGPVVTYFALNWHLGFRDPDGDRHDRRAGQLAAGAVVQSGNPRQGAGCRRGPGLKPSTQRSPIPAAAMLTEVQERATMEPPRCDALPGMI